MLFGGRAIRERTGALKHQINIQRLPGQLGYLGNMTQWHQRLINGQQRARARDTAGVTPIVGIVSREVHHGVCIGDFIDGSQLQFGADLGPALVYPQ